MFTLAVFTIGAKPQLSMGVLLRSSLSFRKGKKGRKAEGHWSLLGGIPPRIA